MRDLERNYQYEIPDLLKTRILKPLTDVKLYEVKSKSVRILVTIKKKVCWLLLGFIKKSNKTPPRHIDTALQRARDIPD